MLDPLEGATMTTPSTLTRQSDPWEMALIHRLIRRGFEQSIVFTRAPDASSRASEIAQYVDFHLTGLHAHHTSEDELMWPLLRERAHLAEATVQRMEDQHAALSDSIESARAELQTWRTAPSTAGSESLATALGSVVEGLTEHLAEEERDIVPLIAVHVSQAEWEHLGQVAFSKFTPRQRFTAMGELLASASPTEASRMLAGLPAPVRIVWRLVGRRRYERFMARVRGSG